MEPTCHIKCIVVFLYMSSYVMCDKSETINALKNVDGAVIDEKRSEKQTYNSPPTMEQIREKKDSADIIESFRFHQRIQSQMIQDLVNEVQDIKAATYFLATALINRAEIPYSSSCNGTTDLASCLLPQLSKLYTDLSIPVRLVGGREPSRGRVEVFYDGEWTTVCNEGWSWDDSKIVCRMLGYSDGNTLDSMFIEGGHGAQKMSNMRCTGNEDSLLACPFDRPSRGCDHFKDAGVRCYR